jgi:hypothetical protein
MKTFRVLMFAVAFSSAVAFSGKPDEGLGGFTKDEARKEQHLPGLEVVPVTVVKLAVRTNGWWIVTLDNGQVWSQTENRANARVQVGDNVTLRKSRIGSYVLTTTDGIQTRIRRER